MVKKKKKRAKDVEVQSLDGKDRVNFEDESPSPDKKHMDQSRGNIDPRSPSKILQSSRVMQEYNKNGHLPIEEQVRDVS